jgi:hypothetical protein
LLIGAGGVFRELVRRVVRPFVEEQNSADHRVGDANGVDKVAEQQKNKKSAHFYDYEIF